MTIGIHTFLVTGVLIFLIISCDSDKRRLPFIWWIIIQRLIWFWRSHKHTTNSIPMILDFFIGIVCQKNLLIMLYKTMWGTFRVSKVKIQFISSHRKQTQYPLWRYHNVKTSTLKKVPIWQANYIWVVNMVTNNLQQHCLLVVHEGDCWIERNEIIFYNILVS